MGKFTFGFMGAGRDDRANIDLFNWLRNTALESFAAEKVCDLSEFRKKSVEESQREFCGSIGKLVGELQERLFSESKKQGREKVSLPDVQSVFLYAFTAGVNDGLFSFYDQRIGDSSDVPMDQILRREFPIRGPEWVCAAANHEMPSIENVFCEFQNKIIVPVAKNNPSETDLADVLAGSFLWAYLAGGSWFIESVKDVWHCFCLAGREVDPSETSVYQIKKGMIPILGEDVEHVVERVRLLKRE